MIIPEFNLNMFQEWDTTNMQKFNAICVIAPSKMYAFWMAINPQNMMLERNIHVRNVIMILFLDFKPLVSDILLFNAFNLRSFDGVLKVNFMIEKTWLAI